MTVSHLRGKKQPGFAKAKAIESFVTFEIMTSCHLNRHSSHLNQGLEIKMYKCHMPECTHRGQRTTSTLPPSTTWFLVMKAAH